MSVLTKLFPRSVPTAGGGITPATFVAANNMGTGSNPTADFTGAFAGDFAFVYATNTTNTVTPPTGWTAFDPMVVSGPADNHLLYKPSITSGDISSPPTFTMGGGMAFTVIYRGADGVNSLLEEPNGGAGANITIAGVTKGASCLNLVVFMTRGNTIDGATFPTNWTRRVAETPATARSAVVGDVDADDYTSGTDIDVTLTGAFNFNRDVIIRVVELT
jgi:hypothetical protein